MTRHRQQFTREGAGFAFKSPKTKALAANTATLARINAQRVPCPICNLGILPGAMQAHTETVHGDDI